MAIQHRRGEIKDLLRNNLLPGEYAISTDGTITICYGGGKTKDLASLKDLLDFSQTNADQHEELKQLILNVDSDLNISNSNLEAAKEKIAENSLNIKTLSNNTSILDNKLNDYNKEITSARDNEKSLGDRLNKIETGERLQIDVIPEIATEAEAREGINDIKLMTPLKVAQAIESLSPGGGGGGETGLPNLRKEVIEARSGEENLKNRLDKIVDIIPPGVEGLTNIEIENICR